MLNIFEINDLIHDKLGEEEVFDDEILSWLMKSSIRLTKNDQEVERNMLEVLKNCQETLKLSDIWITHAYDKLIGINCQSITEFIEDCINVKLNMQRSRSKPFSNKAMKIIYNNALTKFRNWRNKKKKLLMWT